MTMHFVRRLGGGEQIALAAVSLKGSTLKAYQKISRAWRHVTPIGIRTITIALALVIGAGMPRIGCAQSNQTAVAPGNVLPEAIYWKQTLFQIPYQWSSAAEPGAANLVCLHLSKDRGATWQKISEARPNVSSFNYRAEGDGEYWFAVRTVDHQGRPWPSGELQPELRVMVDTTMPRIDQLQAVLRNAQTVDITWAGFDANLDPNSWRFEAQSDPNSPWQPVQLTNSSIGAADNAGFNAGGQNSGRAAWQLPPGQAPIALRATVSDHAGNSATFRSEVQLASGGTGIVTRLPSVSPGPLSNDQPTVNPFVGAAAIPSTQPSPASSTETAAPGWISGSEAAAASTPLTAQPTDQSWPANTMSHTPFRLWSSGINTPSDNVTSYGSPIEIDSRQRTENYANDTTNTAGVSAKYAAASQSADPTSGRPFQPLQPFRQAADAQQPTEEASALSAVNETAPAKSSNDSTDLPPTEAYTGQQSAAVNSKLIGSRTFALEYELEDVGHWGVSQVELWGTRDGGKSWRMFAQDDDQRSPLSVTVDEEGQYGFRIVVESAEGTTAPRPQPGDVPELWVTVDLQQPVAELTAIGRGAGNAADQLILHWRAEDDNLESRPISLYYSSRPNGPWSVVATNLQNTGQYAWRIERHVPERFYLRLEARDAAGNMAAFHTREPIEFAASAPTARLNTAEPIDTTATGDNASYR
jgi:hypothetical protein